MSMAEYQERRAADIREVIERAAPIDSPIDTYNDELILSTNRPIVTIGGPPVLPVEIFNTSDELIHSIGPLLDDNYDSEGNSLTPGDSETDEGEEDYVSMHGLCRILDPIPPNPGVIL